LIRGGLKMITQNYHKIPKETKIKYKWHYEILDQFSGIIGIMLTNTYYVEGEEIKGFTIIKRIN
jgi:hypothetical protein